MERYQDKVVPLITGAGGRRRGSCFKRLLCEGAKVAFSDFSQEGRWTQPSPG